MVTKSSSAPTLLKAPETALTLERIERGFALIDRARVAEPLAQLFDPSTYGSSAKALRDGRAKRFKLPALSASARCGTIVVAA